MTSKVKIYAMSDSLGETAEMVARATASQFDDGDLDIVRLSYINSVDQIKLSLEEAAKSTCIICHTLVSPELREALETHANKYNLVTVDIMGPMMEATQKFSGLVPRLTPGLIHRLDQDYFRRVEAVEFAVKYDDGKNPSGLRRADIVIIGISRTSKTPLSMYLAHKKLKVANIPLVPECSPPEQLYEVPPQKVVGLIINPDKLNGIRNERMKVMGLPPENNYANIDRINQELEYARTIMDKIGCPVIDVSNKAIEETANRILEIANRNKQELQNAEGSQ
ncbi:MAG TPA: pyruvate, water dikinase regulatory protein [Patescibacteria group bacterium]|nr:pyruvate, water dikinase regulatory protein [Patescibacteria group bacterium]